MPLCGDKALKPPRECIKLWCRCSNSENSGMVSLPVLQNCNHFWMQLCQIFIEKSFVCVHFSSFVYQCERLICVAIIVVTAFAAEEGAQHWSYCFSPYMNSGKKFLATIVMLAKFQLAIAVISTIDCKPSRIPQNAEIHSTCHFFVKISAKQDHMNTNWYA